MTQQKVIDVYRYGCIDIYIDIYDIYLYINSVPWQFLPYLLLRSGINHSIHLLLQLYFRQCVFYIQ